MRALLVLLLAVPAAVQEEGPWIAPKEGLCPRLSRRQEGRWSGPFFFVVMADPQFGMMTDRKRERLNAEAAVAHVNRLRPRFVVILGDLTHAVPGAKGYDEQSGEFRSVFGGIDRKIPLLLVPGNHDLGKKATPEALATWRRSYGDDYYSFWSGGTQGLVLNTHLYWDSSGAPDDHKRQEEWLAVRLAEAKSDPPRHLLVFQHHPWFLKTPQDPDGYDVIPRSRRLPALAALKDAGVRHVFAGHYHGHVRARDGDLEVVVAGSVGKPLRKDPSGFCIVEVRTEGVRSVYYGLDAVPESVRMDP